MRTAIGDILSALERREFICLRIDALTTGDFECTIDCVASGRGTSIALAVNNALIKAQTAATFQARQKQIDREIEEERRRKHEALRREFGYD